MKAKGALALLLALFAGLVVAESWKSPGGEFRLKEATPIGELLQHPERYHNRDVRIEGLVASACLQEGCFIEVVPEDGGEGILVSFADTTGRFPTDSRGRHAAVEGMFYRKIYPAARVRHWQGHSYREGRAIPEFALIARIHATAARLGGERAAPPEAPAIRAAATDRIDLGAMEFEAEGFGTGRKLLEAGGTSGRHSTGRYREIIVCLEGEVTVWRQGAGAVVLRPGEMSYIPAGTEHEVSNAGDRPAVYLFTFSRAPEPEGAPHTH